MYKPLHDEILRSIKLLQEKINRGASKEELTMHHDFLVEACKFYLQSEQENLYLNYFFDEVSK